VSGGRDRFEDASPTVQVVSIGILRGLGDTRTPLIANLIGYWLFALPLSLFLGFRIGPGPRGSGGGSWAGSSSW